MATINPKRTSAKLAIAKKTKSNVNALRWYLKDHESRLFNDAKKFDAQLISAGYMLQYKTEWCRLFSEKRHSQRSASPSVSTLGSLQTDLNLISMSE